MAAKIKPILERDGMFRRMDPHETLEQIGRMNVAAISGLRVGAILNEEAETVGVFLPVHQGYTVEVLLAGNDTYTVRRVFTRAGKRFVKGVETNVYMEQVGDSAYRASCYVNVDFGEE